MVEEDETNRTMLHERLYSKYTPRKDFFVPKSISLEDLLYEYSLLFKFKVNIYMVFISNAKIFKNSVFRSFKFILKLAYASKMY